MGYEKSAKHPLHLLKKKCMRNTVAWVPPFLRKTDWVLVRLKKVLNDCLPIDNNCAWVYSKRLIRNDVQWRAAMRAKHRVYITVSSGISNLNNSNSRNFNPHRRQYARNIQCTGFAKVLGCTIIQRFLAESRVRRPFAVFSLLTHGLRVILTLVSTSGGKQYVDIKHVARWSYLLRIFCF